MGALLKISAKCRRNVGEMSAKCWRNVGVSSGSPMVKDRRPVADRRSFLDDQALATLSFKCYDGMTILQAASFHPGRPEFILLR